MENGSRTLIKGFECESFTITAIAMARNNVVTKEVMKKHYKGKFKHDHFFKISVHDDLDSFFEQTKNFRFIDPSVIGTFFLPKLTNEELLLLKNKDENYLKLYAEYHFGQNPDVDETEMMKSKSKSKFAYCLCQRISRSFSSFTLHASSSKPMVP